MEYYVVWPDGQRFGPADEDVLGQWAWEGRITPDTDLLCVETGLTVKARSLERLEFRPEPEPPTQAVMTDEPYAGYGVPDSSDAPMGSPYPAQAASSASKSDTSTAWGLTIVGFASTFFLACCCPYLSVFSLAVTGVGVYYANRGRKKGEPGATAAFWTGVGVLTFQVLLVVAGVVWFAAGLVRSMGP